MCCQAAAAPCKKRQGSSSSLQTSGSPQVLRFFVCSATEVLRWVQEKSAACSLSVLHAVKVEAISLPGVSITEVNSPVSNRTLLELHFPLSVRGKLHERALILSGCGARASAKELAESLPIARSSQLHLTGPIFERRSRLFITFETSFF